MTVPPWTPEQVDKLNEYQNCDWVHEFTCVNNDRNKLVAQEDGFHCPQCGYHQKWAHDFMLKGAPPHPFTKE